MEYTKLTEMFGDVLQLMWIQFTKWNYQVFFVGNNEGTLGDCENHPYSSKVFLLHFCPPQFRSTSWALYHRNTCFLETVCTAVTRPGLAVLEVSGFMPNLLKAQLENVGQSPYRCPTGSSSLNFPLDATAHIIWVHLTVKASEHNEEHES